MCRGLQNLSYRLLEHLLALLSPIESHRLHICSWLAHLAWAICSLCFPVELIPFTSLTAITHVQQRYEWSTHARDDLQSLQSFMARIQPRSLEGGWSGRIVCIKPLANVRDLKSWFIPLLPNHLPFLELMTLA